MCMVPVLNEEHLLFLAFRFAQHQLPLQRASSKTYNMATTSRERSIANKKHSPSPALLIWCYCCCMLVAILNVVSAKESDAMLDSNFTYSAPLPPKAVSTNPLPQSLPSSAQTQDPNIPVSPENSVLGSAIPGAASIDLLTPTPSPTLNGIISPDTSPRSTPSSSTSAAPAATEPIFPPKSVACQQCKYFYPKLVECNRIANHTLSSISIPPQTGQQTSTSVSGASTENITNTTTSSPGSRNATINAPESASSSSKATLGGYGYSPESMSPFLSMTKLLSNPGASTAAAVVSDPSTDGSMIGGGSGNGGSIGDGSLNGIDSTGVDFIALLPFLQCICPNQGLAASRVCMACFRVSDQPNYLSELEGQNVTSSLSAYAQACADSGDGRHLPRSAGSPASSTNEGSSTKSRKQSIIEALFRGILLAVLLQVE